MREQRWFNLVAVTVALSVLAVGAIAIAVPASGPTTAATAGGAGSPTVYRNLSIVYNAASGTYNYNNRDLTVPMNVRVVFTITNYDPSVGVLPTPSSAVVAGTFDGAMMMQRGGSMASMGALPLNGVSHTFSMSSGFYHLNVPIPPAASAAVPSQVSFAVVFHTPGSFAWGCVILCGVPAQGMPDEMFGLVTVG